MWTVIDITKIVDGKYRQLFISPDYADAREWMIDTQDWSKIGSGDIKVSGPHY